MCELGCEEYVELSSFGFAYFNFMAKMAARKVH